MNAFCETDVLHYGSVLCPLLFAILYFHAYTPPVIHFCVPKRSSACYARMRGIQNHFYTISAPCQLWHFFNTISCFWLRQITAKLYLVHFLRMQSQPRLQEGVVGVVINFLVRQRGSYITWPCLPACGNTIPATTVDWGLCTTTNNRCQSH